MTFCYIFYFFYVDLDFSRKSYFELQVHEILNFGAWKNDIYVFECVSRACAKTNFNF